jgi:hypothetical protein
VVNDESARLSAELAALDGSKSSVLSLAGAQQRMLAAQQQMLTTEQQMRSSQQQMQSTATALGARLAALEKTVAANGAQLTSLRTSPPRRVDTFPLRPRTSPLVTGSIDAVRAASPAQPLPAPVPAPVQSKAVPPSTVSVAKPPPSPPVATTATADPGPHWTAIAALPTFATTTAPAASVPAAGAAAGTASATAAGTAGSATPPAPPLPMAPRPTVERATSDADVAPTPAGAIGRRATHRARPDVKAIGIAIGNPVTPDSALGSWQQIAENVGVLLVGTSPLLADDPSGGAGKVLVAGPLPGIAAATALCGKIEQAALSCRPMPYVGAELNAAANYQ